MLWRNGEHKEVGRRAIALTATHLEKGFAYANHLIHDCGGQRTYSIPEFDAIMAIPKSKAGRKLGNVTMLWMDINMNSGRVLFCVRENKLLLRHVFNAK